MAGRGGPLDADWGERAFGEPYTRVYAHRDRADARRDVAAFSSWVGGVAGPLLDVGCGTGRHLAAWAERGVRAVGVERSLALVAQAPRDVRARIVRADGQRLPFADGAFTCATLFFQVLAHGTEDLDLALLREVARVLAPSALVVVDVLDPDRTAAGLVRRERRASEGGELFVARRIARGRVRKRVVFRGARPFAFVEDVRLVRGEELAGLLTRAGFDEVRLAGHLDGRPHAPGSPRLVALGRRPG